MQVAMERGVRDGGWIRHPVLRERLRSGADHVRQRLRATVPRDLELGRLPTIPAGARGTARSTRHLCRLSELSQADHALAAADDDSDMKAALRRTFARVAFPARAGGVRILLYHAIGD